MSFVILSEKRARAKGKWKPHALRILDAAERAVAREKPGVGDFDLCRIGLIEVSKLVGSYRCPTCLLPLSESYRCPDCDRFVAR